MKALTFLASLIGFCLPAGAAALLAWKLSKRSRDEWRLLAFVPILPLALWGPYIAWATTRDPTSHNLFPLELLFWGALSAALFGAFVLLRKLFGGPRDDWSSRRDRDGTG